MNPDSVKNSGKKRKNVMSMDLKRKIIEKYEQGVRVKDLAVQFNRTTSTICTILKQKDSIKAITPAKGVKIISKLRNSALEKMENLLFLWLLEKRLAGDTLSESKIREKARLIYADLISENPGTSGQEQFKASRGWFENFRKRTGIHSVSRNDLSITLDPEDKIRIIDSSEIFSDSKTLDLSEKKKDIIHPTAGHKAKRELFAEGEQTTIAGEVMEEIVYLGRAMGLDMNEGELQELVKAHSKVLLSTTQELPKPQLPRELELKQELKEKAKEEIISSEEIKEILAMWSKVSEFVEKNHPEKATIRHASAIYFDACLKHFKNILNERQKQNSSDSIVRWPAVKTEERKNQNGHS